jgi:hypothetical protein
MKDDRTNHEAGVALSEGLAAVAARLDPEGAKGAATLLVQGQIPFAPPGALSQGPTAVAARLDPEGAKSVASLLIQAMKNTDNSTLAGLSRDLAVVAARLEPREGAASCAQAAALLSQAMKNNATNILALAALYEGLGAMAARLDPEGAKGVAILLMHAMGRRSNFRFLGQTSLPQDLTVVLTREPLLRRTQRALSAIGSVAPGSSPALVVAPPLAFDAMPEALPPQVLVDLLKHPLCVGEARRLVLDQLQRHYKRPFTDQWDFVHFAEENNLGLDLTSPPQVAATDANR